MLGGSGARFSEACNRLPSRIVQCHRTTCRWQVWSMTHLSSRELGSLEFQRLAPSTYVNGLPNYSRPNSTLHYRGRSRWLAPWEARPLAAVVLIPLKVMFVSICCLFWCRYGSRHVRACTRWPRGRRLPSTKACLPSPICDWAAPFSTDSLSRNPHTPWKCSSFHQSLRSDTPLQCLGGPSASERRFPS